MAIEIKGETVSNRKREGSYRLGRINLNKEWMLAVAVLMDKDSYPYARPVFGTSGLAETGLKSAI